MERNVSGRGIEFRVRRMVGIGGGTLLWLGSLMLPTPAPAIELVPSVGLTRAVEPGDVKSCKHRKAGVGAGRVRSGLLDDDAGPRDRVVTSECACG